MHPVRRQISRHAAPLRRNATDAETILWAALRNRQLGGHKFRRQWTVGSYVADFACLEAMLIVELDGGHHTEEGDAARTHFLEQHDYRVLRIWNNEAIENQEGVLQVILDALEDRRDQKKTLTQPSPAKAGEG